MSDYFRFRYRYFATWVGLTMYIYGLTMPHARGILETAIVTWNKNISFCLLSSNSLIMRMLSHWRQSGFALGCLCQFLLLLSPARAQDATDNRTELRIVYITSSGGEYNSSGTIPAIEIALEQINDRSDVLPDYRLKYELGDSQVAIAI